MRFCKYQGLGNDFVIIDNSTGTFIGQSGEFFTKICDRHFGVGADGVILVLPAQEGCSFTMRMFNPDGSEAQMCGNGIRCMTRFIVDKIWKKTYSGLEAISIPIWTAAGRIVPTLLPTGNVRVDMNVPPTLSQPNPAVVDAEICVDDGGHAWQGTAVSMGNPHCVLFLEDEALPLKDMDSRVERVGAMIESLPCFPERTNVEFVHVLNKGNMRVQVFERGAARTLSCGTGACACVVAGVLSGRCERDCVVHLKHGQLRVHWDFESNHVYMEGPAEAVFEGDFFAEA
eukprot:GSChrysophyteH1.ASY1.ANO1.882.1 assembled CDS